MLLLHLLITAIQDGQKEEITNINLEVSENILQRSAQSTKDASTLENDCWHSIIRSLSEKDTVDVTQGKGIELLSQVDLIEDAQFEEVRKKSMRDFHKTYLSGSGTVTKTAPSAAKIKPFVTSEGNGVKLGVSDVTEEESSKSETESWGNNEDNRNNEQESNGEDSDQKNDSSESDQEVTEEDKYDEEEVKDELIKTPSNDSDDEDETKIIDKAEGDEDEEMYYTTSQLYDDVDIRLNEPVDTNKEFVQEEGTNAAMTNIQ
ncbi:hypothetical protein Tco_1036127 [Tanacetum coccineum]